ETLSDAASALEADFAAVPDLEAAVFPFSVFCAAFFTFGTGVVLDAAPVFGAVSFAGALAFAAAFLARCLSRFHCLRQSRQIAYSLKIGSPFSLVPICLFFNSSSFPHIGHFINLYSSLLLDKFTTRTL